MTWKSVANASSTTETRQQAAPGTQWHVGPTYSQTFWKVTIAVRPQLGSGDSPLPPDTGRRARGWHSCLSDRINLCDIIQPRPITLTSVIDVLNFPQSVATQKGHEGNTDVAQQCLQYLVASSCRRKWSLSSHLLGSFDLRGWLQGRSPPSTMTFSGLTKFLSATKGSKNNSVWVWKHGSAGNNIQRPSGPSSWPLQG